MKKFLRLSRFFSKKILSATKASLSYERGPCQIMNGLIFKSIPVNYASAIINDSVDRSAQVKIWKVAVKTTEPNIIARSHAEWMLDIQMQRALTSLLIGEILRSEILMQCKSYSVNVPIRRHIVVKNT